MEKESAKEPIRLNEEKDVHETGINFMALKNELKNLRILAEFNKLQAEIARYRYEQLVYTEKINEIFLKQNADNEKDKVFSQSNN